MKNARLKIIITAVLILLLVPFIAMQFTDEVNWTLSDFVVAGVLLLATGLLVDFVMQKVTKISYRIVLFIVIVILFLIVWAELAVGILGQHLLEVDGKAKTSSEDTEKKLGKNPDKLK